MKSILEILSQHIEEVRVSDIVGKVSGDDESIVNRIEMKLSRKFTEDRNLPKQTTLKKRHNNKKIKVWFKWNHDITHDLITRIENRTNLKSVNEFSEIFIDVINTLLPDYIGHLINTNGKYGVHLEEYGMSIIFHINLNGIQFGKSNEMFIDVRTILMRGGINPKTVLKIFHI